MKGQPSRPAAQAFAIEHLPQLAADVLVWRKQAALPEVSKVHELATLCAAYCMEGDQYQEAERLIVQCALDNAACPAETSDQQGVEHAGAASIDLGQAALSKEAYQRLLPKLLLLSETVDDMSDDQYGEWINGLPKDEFFEFIGVNHDEESFKAAVAAARQQASKTRTVVSAAS